MVNTCVPKKSPDICLGEIKIGIKLALAFTVKQNNIKKHMPITS